MTPAFDESFLLGNDAARALYARASRIPIFDYHNHLNAKDILDNAPFHDLAALFLGDDHYKWRLTRANGAPERFVSGDACGYEKFLAYASALPLAAGSPLPVWNRLELWRYFGIDAPLSGESAKAIWDQAREMMRGGGFTPRALLARSNVKALVTTDDPADDLSYHARLAKDASFPVKVLPGFRPERAGEVWRGADWRKYIQTLSEAANVEIKDYPSLLGALEKRMAAFAALGCVCGDYSMERVPFARATEAQLDAIFKKALAAEPVSQDEADQYLTELLLWLASSFAKRGWVMELHIGPVRARNSRMTALVGRDAGFDAMADHTLMRDLGGFLDALCEGDKLPKTILFNLNPKDGAAFAALAATFQDESFPSKMQYGPAWWMNDHRDGIRAQLSALGQQGLLGRFIGMASDSRSYLAFARHEYFRRALCDLLGEWIERGEYPYGEQEQHRLVAGVCFDNAAAYFGLK